MDFSTSLTNPVRPLVSPFHQSSRQLIAPPTHSSVRHCADQSADNGPDRGSAKRDPSSIATVMDVMNDLMPWRRRRRAMRTTPPSVMRRGNRRTCRQHHASHENRNRLDDLVHITPPFPDFCPLQRGRRHHRQNLTRHFNPPHSPSFMPTPDIASLDIHR